MATSNTTRSSSRRRGASGKPQSSEETNIEKPEVNAMSGESASLENGASAAEAVSEEPVKIEARPAKSKAASKGELQLRPLSTLQNRPVMPSQVEVIETMTVAGIRPIEASHLALVGSFLNGRPISASSLRVMELLPGDRPVFASDFKMMEGGLLPGDRPVMASDPQLMHASTLPGNRPIASNEIDDPEALMGYID